MKLLVGLVLLFQASTLQSLSSCINHAVKRPTLAFTMNISVGPCLGPHVFHFASWRKLRVAHGSPIDGIK